MPNKSPIAKIKDAAGQLTGAAVGTVVDTGQKVVGQAAGAAGAVVSRVPGRRKPASSRHQPESPTLQAVPQDAPARSHGDPVKPAAKKTPAKKTPAKKAATTKAATTKGTVTKATAPKKTAKKTAAKKTTAKKAVKKTAAKKTPAKKTPASRRSPR